MRRPPGNDLLLGDLPGQRARLRFPREERGKHLYICGGTGTGKSRFLENLIRQDIRQWQNSKCGMLVLDPHGSLYDNVMSWVALTRYNVPIIPIDLRQDEWVVSYNLLRQRKSADPGVVVRNLISAMAYVWGQSGTDETPLFEQWAGNILRTLYEKNLTLLDAEYLVNRVATEMRRSLTSDVKNESVQSDWTLANALSPKDFDAQIGSTVRRLRRFLGTEKIRNTFGLSDVSLDFGKVIEEGGIVIVNLATQGAKISKEDGELFATLLLNDLWTAAQERGKRDRIKPFYVYLDEFQRFVSPTISENLDEARGFGLHLTMANQFPGQLIDRGPQGERLYNSIMETASTKVVFRLQHEKNLRAMAEWLFGGVLDPDEIKLQLTSTKVMGYREEMREIYSRSTSSGSGSGTQIGHASGSGFGGTKTYPEFGMNFTPASTSKSSSRFTSSSSSNSDSWSEGESSGVADVPMLIPEFGEEVSHIQYRSLDEQIYRAMAVLFDQQERQCVARIVGMKAPVSLITPEVKQKPISKRSLETFFRRSYAKLPFALPTASAQLKIADRAKTIAALLLQNTADEPTTTKRRIR